MSQGILMQFLGFESKEDVREYKFQVRETAQEPREFRLTIDQAAFTRRLLRFQDAPDVCSSRLRQELTANDNHPQESHFHITPAEIDEYREKHSVPKRNALYPVRTEEY